VAILLLAAIAVPVAISKELRTTVCGRNECRTVTNGISGIATLPGPVPAPRDGRFYTVLLRLNSDGWKVVYEQRRQIVRAADARARSFLGPRWARLTAELRNRFDLAVRGLEPMRTAPR
jgi:hypothetical protein